jgi:hypothetical protein
MFGLFIAVVATGSNAQPPEDESRGSPARSARSQPSNTAAVDAIVARMMVFDKNHDGKLTRDEITDPRLQRLFDRADANHDGVVTKEELTTLAQKMVAESGSGRSSRRGPGGPDGGGFGAGPDGPGGGFFGRPGGGMGRGPRPPQPGQVLSPRTQEMLLLTAAQKAKIEALQKEVDAKLAEILTDEQKNRLKEMRNRGSDGPPPPPGGEGPPNENGSPNGNGPGGH